MSIQMFPKSSKVMWLVILMVTMMLWTSACGWGMSADLASKNAVAEEPPAEEPADEQPPPRASQ